MWTRCHNLADDPEDSSYAWNPVEPTADPVEYDFPYTGTSPPPTGDGAGIGWDEGASCSGHVWVMQDEDQDGTFEPRLLVVGGKTGWSCGALPLESNYDLDRVIVYGGHPEIDDDDNELSPAFAVDITLELSGGLLGTWTTKAPALTKRTVSSIVLLPNGEMLLSGGIDSGLAIGVFSTVQ